MALQATLDASVDAEVELTFHVINSGTAAIELEFKSGKTADVAIYPEDSDEPVWRWSENRMFTQAMATETLDADEAFEQVFTWADPSPGRYTAVATLEADRDTSAKTTFRV